MDEGPNVFNQLRLRLVLQGFGGKQNHFIGEEIIARGVRDQPLAAHEETGFVAERAVFGDAKKRPVFLADHLDERPVRQNSGHGGPGGLLLRFFNCLCGFLLH